MPRPRSNTAELKVDPLVKEFFAKLDASGLTYEQLGALAGVSPETIVRWRKRTMPNLGTFSACLQVVGYELTFQKADNGEHQMSNVRELGTGTRN